MASNVIKSGAVPFKAEGRLLQELGLRLVASPEVALVELIKNAYDADSPDCLVHLATDGDDANLVVEDHGQGMTLDDFIERWMQIATSSKANRESSDKFQRKMTGAKGIGRFAVRYLGDHLLLESIAYDPKRKERTILKAQFDWPRLDNFSNLAEVTIPYELLHAPHGVSTGTKLTISKLRVSADFVHSRDLRTDILRIVSPLSGLNSGHIPRQLSGVAEDPGFDVVLPGDKPADDKRLADLILSHYWARLTVALKKRTLTISVEFPNRKNPKQLRVPVKTDISNGFFADIRFFPRRKGIFQDKEVDGRAAWKWVRDNSGVAVVDHGFRIKPYGFEDDDWLMLDIDGAHNRRDWRSDIANEHFQIPEAQRGRPGDNPALNLPHNSQLVGAVFIECARPSQLPENHDLVPAMDREGLLQNEGFQQLWQYVRAGIEFLALCDKKELVRRAEIEARRAASRAREDIRDAIADIESNTDLTKTDRARIVKQYATLAEQLEEQEEYASASRRSLITMSLLGIVAGYMTHECDAMLHELTQANQELKKLAPKHPSVRVAQQNLEHRLEAFKGYVKYSRLFIGRARSLNIEPFRVAGQIQHVVRHFQPFADERGIKVDKEVSRDLVGPAIPVTAYSGILLNLLTNALKAVLSVKTSIDDPTVLFRGWNEGGHHCVEVLDNGAGIPPQMRKRIWDPLYTTTADDGNPLGSGMGLGLTLVKQVTAEFGGRVSLITPPPPDFTTCFRVTFPME